MEKQTLENVAFEIITNAGMAKSRAMEALYAAKAANFEESEKLLKEADNYNILAERAHMNVITSEAQGNLVNPSVLFIHAEDQLMNCQTIILLTQEIIELHKKQ